MFNKFVVLSWLQVVPINLRNYHFYITTGWRLPKRRGKKADLLSCSCHVSFYTTSQLLISGQSFVLVCRRISHVLLLTGNCLVTTKADSPTLHQHRFKSGHKTLIFFKFYLIRRLVYVPLQSLQRWKWEQLSLYRIFEVIPQCLCNSQWHGYNTAILVWKGWTLPRI